MARLVVDASITLAGCIPEEENAFALARGLTVYDAADRELARRRRLPLATLDRELARAAGALGVTLLPAATEPPPPPPRPRRGKRP